ncbi:hypothetical protein Dda_1585 [Drechslerella dactyloides]|uniref:Peptidase S8/S53 domain-containing protein n=1 Tax=Drechslerella dactyloides TaxID=74499 RepID=A0AAD6J3C1_DREDA|nr:hypothetical protein Dda_1585 [Drechslerella dactyloides]
MGGLSKEKIVTLSTSLFLVYLCRLVSTVASPEFDLNLRVPTSRQNGGSTSDLWVFTVREGYGKDERLNEVRSYIKENIGSDKKNTWERWFLHNEDEVAWFYLRTELRVAEEITKRWNSVILYFSSVSDEINDFEQNTNPEPYRKADDRAEGNVATDLHYEGGGPSPSRPSPSAPSPSGPTDLESDAAASFRYFVEALRMVEKAIQAKLKKNDGSSTGPKILVAFSNILNFEFLKPDYLLRNGGPYEQKLQEMFQDTIAKICNMPNVAVIAPSGEYKAITYPQGIDANSETEPIERYPATLGADPEAYPNLIVVGTISVPYGRAVWYTADYVNVSVPVDGIQIPVLSATSQDYTMAKGPLIAPAIVCGVLATFISAHGDSVAEARERLYQLAYPRQPKDQVLSPENRALYPPVVYNGFNPRASSTSLPSATPGSKEHRKCTHQRREVSGGEADDECSDGRALGNADAEKAETLTSAPSSTDMFGSGR